MFNFLKLSVLRVLFFLFLFFCIDLLISGFSSLSFSDIFNNIFGICCFIFFLFILYLISCFFIPAKNDFKKNVDKSNTDENSDMDLQTQLSFKRIFITATAGLLVLIEFGLFSFVHDNNHGDNFFGIWFEEQSELGTFNDESLDIVISVIILSLYGLFCYGIIFHFYGLLNNEDVRILRKRLLWSSLLGFFFIGLFSFIFLNVFNMRFF